MAIIVTDAVLLKKTEIRETSLILDFYTKDHGRVRGVIKGVRSPQPQFGALYELFSLDRIVYYESKNKDLFVIARCELVEYFSGIRSDIERISHALYYTELIDATCGLGERNTAIFTLLTGCLAMLGAGENPRHVTKVFEIKLLGLLGLMPELKNCVECRGTDFGEKVRFTVSRGGVICSRCAGAGGGGLTVSRGAVNFLESVSSMPLDKVGRVKIVDTVFGEMELFTKFFLDFHIQKRFKSVEFMKQIGV
ncbi:MAG: DNA repair protein RecO [Candidatus Omnitrophica bacterium]|nr:DNA repair protein RecO [Candidatus Omnitrophota bacterium]